QLGHLFDHSHGEGAQLDLPRHVHADRDLTDAQPHARLHFDVGQHDLALLRGQAQTRLRLAAARGPACCAIQRDDVDDHISLRIDDHHLIAHHEVPIAAIGGHFFHDHRWQGCQPDPVARHPYADRDIEVDVGDTGPLECAALANALANRRALLLAEPYAAAATSPLLLLAGRGLLGLLSLLARRRLFGLLLLPLLRRLLSALALLAFRLLGPLLLLLGPALFSLLAFALTRLLSLLTLLQPGLLRLLPLFLTRLLRLLTLPQAGLLRLLTFALARLLGAGLTLLPSRSCLLLPWRALARRFHSFLGAL